MTRSELIDKGKLWQVCPASNIDTVYFEGTKTRCMDWMKVNCWHEYKRYKIRLCKVILELENCPPQKITPYNK